ncbi:MAG TPA: NADH-quinone oxidoreductase subunit J [Candidatus Limnocylindrales bacterium]|jgi:NADH:ubiquinone oxidoreductase subunit 6 (subunit J)
MPSDGGLGIPPLIPILNWAWDDLLFVLLAGIMLAAAVFVVAGRDIIRSGLAMIVAFAALAGIYVLLGAVIVAAAQVLIYIGAISVLILFAIMLTETKVGPARLVFHGQAWAGLLAALGLGVLVLLSIISTAWPGKEAQRIGVGTEAVAQLLFRDPLYVLALQVVGVLLTAAVIGGVFLAKREEATDPGERPSTLERIERPVIAAAASDGRNLAGGQEGPASRAAGAGGANR